MLEGYGHARDAEAARAVRTMRTILETAQKPAQSLAAENGEPSVSD
jgi:hypothetical protein